MPGFLMVFGIPSKAVVGGYNLEVVVQQLINSLMNLGAIIGCMSVGGLEKWISRRQFLWIASVFCCLAAVVMTSSSSYGGA
jgi:SP family sugar:H+ symporter-like MFS transporter